MAGVDERADDSPDGSQAAATVPNEESQPSGLRAGGGIGLQVMLAASAAEEPEIAKNYLAW